VFGPLWVRAESNALTLKMGDGQVAELEYHGGAFFTRWRDPFFREYFGTHVSFTAARDSITGLNMRLNRDDISTRKK